MNHIPVASARSFFWIGLTALALGMFIAITKELLEGEVNALDRSILLAVAGIRVPWLTVAAVDVTALGSFTLVLVFAAFALIAMLKLRIEPAASNWRLPSLAPVFGRRSRRTPLNAFGLR